MSRKYLVTGAAGFIGSHLTQTLLQRGDHVIAIDNLNSYYDPARKRQNLTELRDVGSGTLNFIELDITDAAALERLIADERPEAVGHLAAMAGVRASVEDPHAYYRNNVEGLLNLLEAGRKHGVERFAFASTSSVYGNTTQIPFRESDPCDRPLAPYAASKRAGEMLGFTYHHLYKLHFTVLRFFTVYGPRGRPDMMPYKVLDNIFFGKAVPLFNQGQMRRDWTHVKDTVEGVVAALDRPLGFEVINLGRGEPVLVADFVAEIEKVTGRRAQLADAPLPDTDVPVTYADITKAQKLLDYHPRLSVREGVADFYAWYRRAVLNRTS